MYAPADMTKIPGAWPSLTGTMPDRGEAEFGKNLTRCGGSLGLGPDPDAIVLHPDPSADGMVELLQPLLAKTRNGPAATPNLANSSGLIPAVNSMSCIPNNDEKEPLSKS